MSNKVEVLDHGFVELRNLAGPTCRPNQYFDASDRDPANAARFSFESADQENRPLEADLRLAEYLYKNRHTTPFEMVEVWLEMKMPIFVARQFVRHRTVSINEVSARYVQLPNEFYIPELENIGIKSESNKQGRTIEEVDPLDIPHEVKMYRLRLQANSQDDYERYEQAIDDGIPNELARLNLPLNIYTHWLWNQDLHNLLHFLRLRMHSHAQFESREYANAIHKLLSFHLPNTMAMFDKYEEIGNG